MVASRRSFDSEISTREIMTPSTICLQMFMATGCIMCKYSVSNLLIESPSLSLDGAARLSSITLHHTPTQPAMKDDPTVLAFETGNELKHPPLDWTKSVAGRLKQLSEALVIDGQYGINKAVKNVDAVDIVSNHFYPLFNSKLDKDIKVSLASKCRSIKMLIFFFYL